MAVMYPAFGARANLTVEEDTIAEEENVLPVFDISIVGRVDNKDSKIVEDFVNVVAGKKTEEFLAENYGSTYRIVY